MDITDTLEPKSDQLDAVDLAASGPRTFTISRVVVKPGDQPADIHLVEFPRPWRPNKNTRRLLAAAWGKSEGGAYEGRRVTLFYDPKVEFGGKRVGGVRVSHMSHLPDGKTFSTLILASKARPEMVSVEPLPDVDPEPTRGSKATAPDIATITDRDVLRGMWQSADDATRAAIQARVAELDAAPQPDIDAAWGLTEPDGAR